MSADLAIGKLVAGGRLPDGLLDELLLALGRLGWGDGPPAG